VKTEDRTEEDEDNKIGGQRGGDLSLAPVKCKSKCPNPDQHYFFKGGFSK
jgi:hypothetical protein